MPRTPDTASLLRRELDETRARLAETEETLNAIGNGEVDGLVIAGTDGQRIFTLKGAQEPYRLLIEQMSEAAFTLSKAGDILYANEALTRLLQTPLERVIGAQFPAFVAPVDQPVVADLIEAAWSDGTSTGEASVRNARGLPVPMRLGLSRVQLDQVTVLCVVATDLTGQKSFEQSLQEKNVELEKALLAKDRFLASMSHELRTPLNAIIGFTGTLLMGLPGPLTTAQKKQLQIVKDSAKHQLSLINDLLDLAKIESGKVELNLEPVACKDVLEEVAQTLRPLAEAKGLNFDLLLSDDGEVILQSDRRALNQIVINLINNAIKFTDKGTVGLCLRKTDDAVEITVTDTGIGIKPEDQAKLFKGFTRLNSGAYREGTGLGLHLSQKLGALLGGWIQFKSEYGKGSTFCLVIPNANVLGNWPVGTNERG
jgi:PAS domain S-box-containing protein